MRDLIRWLALGIGYTLLAWLVVFAVCWLATLVPIPQVRRWRA